jgi:hypothetical protein
VELTLRITLTDPPPGVELMLQRGRHDLEPAVRRARRALTFELTARVEVRPGAPPRWLGPFVQGPPAARFVYVNAGTLAGQPDSPWTRRAKVPLGAITAELVERALAEGGLLEAEITGSGRDGGPVSGTVPLRVGWRVAAR